VLVGGGEEVASGTDALWQAQGGAMLGFTRETRVFLRSGVTDLRLSFEGLRGMIVNVSGKARCYVADSNMWRRPRSGRQSARSAVTQSWPAMHKI